MSSRLVISIIILDYNNPNHKFDKGDWDWCPEHKNTPRHFECHRGIKSDKVIDMIKSII